MDRMIRKILVANRGEIAVRVMKTARRLGIGTVAVYSELDSDSLHVTMADESYCIGHSELSETYLNTPKILDIARRAHCDAIHPGYGFLAENPLFVKACEDAGILFIGPGSQAMHMMGNKIEARAFATKAGVPVTEGLTGTKATLMKAKDKISFPVLLKAAAGGGGKGMRIVHDETELKEAIESTSRQAKAYFGDDTVYIEKYIENPRHIEFQILGDHYGNVVHLFERECSIQRRYQKIIEESPSPTLTPEVREKMGEAAVRLGKAIGYRNAGTIEFLVDQDLNFYFLEMNTRIQVEHPVTELVTGTDIVEEQIHIASGEPLRFTQEEVKQKGHAIECRIYAEDPSNQFMPSPGRMTLYKEPETAHVRIDTGVTGATEIKAAFDPMISKLIVWGGDRPEATRLMIAALHEYVIQGIRTNISYLTRLLREPAFADNRISTGFCDLHTDEILAKIREEKNSIPETIPAIAYILSTLHDCPGAENGEPRNLWKQIGHWRSLVSFRLTFEEQELTVKVPRISGHHAEFEIAGQNYVSALIKYDCPRLEFTVGDERYHAFVSSDRDMNSFVHLMGHTFTLRRSDLLPETVPAAASAMHHGDEDHVTAPMPGKVIKIQVEEGEEVKKGSLLLIIEAMKMENAVVSSRDAVVKSINVSVNQSVEASTPLIVFESKEK